MIQLTDDEVMLISHNLVCRIDDYEKEIRKEEKKQGKRLDGARKHHSDLVRLVYTKLIPESKCGEIECMDGTTF